MAESEMRDTIETWLDYMSEKLDLFEVHRNEYLAEYNLPAKNAMFYRDVLLPFCENTLLMDNIAHSEGVGYIENGCRNKLKIRLFIDGNEVRATYPSLISIDGICTKPIEYPDNFPYLVKAKNDENRNPIPIDVAFNNREISNDIEICLSSEHSLYSILENFIRNSAKHNKASINDADGLVINIHIINERNDADYYTIQLTDNVSKLSYSTLKGFHDAINKNLINDNGEAEKSKLGIADMKINAHLLKTDAEITDSNLKEAFEIIYKVNGDFQTFPSDDAKTNTGETIYEFGYQFKLCKPKKVLWVGGPDNHKDALRKKGIIVESDLNNFKSTAGKKAINPLANYQFAILEQDAVKNIKNDSPNYEWDHILINLPHRVLINCTKHELNVQALKKLEENGRIQCVHTPINIEDFTSTNNNIFTLKDNWDFEFLKRCWEEWLRKFLMCDIETKTTKKGCLVLYFEDATIKDKWQKINSKISFLEFKYICGKKTSADEYINIDNGTRVVLYDHHSNGYEWICPQNKLEFYDKSSYLQFGKNSLDFINLFYPSSNDLKNELFLYEAYEAGLSRTVILDERIAEMLNWDKEDKNIKEKITKSQGFLSKEEYIGDYGDLANNGNIILCTSLNGDNISDISNAVLNIDDTSVELKFCEKLYNKEVSNCNALIIHRTYLIKLFDKFKDKKAKKEVMNLLYNKFQRLIVVSGGGYPHSIEFDVNFKPYSRLKSHFVQYPSKISLNNMI